MPVIEFLRAHAPYDWMEAAHLEFLAQRLRLGFYAKDEVITEPSSGPAGFFYVIKQGRVRGEADSSESGALAEEGAWELVPGECFPIGALLAKRAVRTRHRAVEDTFCFELNRKDFESLLAQSAVFRDFCTRRLTNLLDHAWRGVQAASAAESAGDAALGAPLKDIIRRPPVVCRPDTPIRAALQSMHRERVGSIVATDEDARPLGIFTLHDLLSRVVAPGIDLDAPIQKVMTRQPEALPPHAFAFEAALLMASKGFSHVCVAHERRLIGVISERDIFALERVRLSNLTRSIGQAPDVARLADLGRDVHRLVDQLFAQGVSVAQLTQIITQLNDHLTRRVIDLSLAEHDAPHANFTWLSFGSEGRGEQTLKTDQDNGILFLPRPGTPPDQTRVALLPLARRINLALERCGFPLCTGNVMASNPLCCLSLDEWLAQFQRWVEQGTPEQMLQASIFFDLRALHGDDGPVQELHAWMRQHIRGNNRFLRLLAENALRNRPPLGLIHDFVVESGDNHVKTLELKRRGTMPIVDAARVLALSEGVSNPNTLERLRAVAGAGKVPAVEAEAWCEAYGYLMLLRMRRHQQLERAKKPLDNRIDPKALNDLDRRILKESFRQARKLQTRIALDYGL